jgi:hypothetical protein
MATGMEAGKSLPKGKVLITFCAGHLISEDESRMFFVRSTTTIESDD